jgi:hypothetical protein
MDDLARAAESTPDASSITASMAAATASLSSIISAFSSGNPEAFKQVYWKSMLYVPPPPAPPPYIQAPIVASGVGLAPQAHTFCMQFQGVALGFSRHIASERREPHNAKSQT